MRGTEVGDWDDGCGSRSKRVRLTLPSSNTSSNVQGIANRRGVTAGAGAGAVSSALVAAVNMELVSGSGKSAAKTGHNSDSEGADSDGQ